MCWKQNYFVSNLIFLLLFESIALYKRWESTLSYLSEDKMLGYDFLSWFNDSLLKVDGKWIEVIMGLGNDV